MKTTLALLAILFLATGAAVALDKATAAESVAVVEVEAQSVVDVADVIIASPLFEAVAACGAASPNVVVSSNCSAPGWCDSPDDFCGCLYSGGRRGECARAYC